MSSILNKVAGLQLKASCTAGFSLEFSAKIFKTPAFQHLCKAAFLIICCVGKNLAQLPNTSERQSYLQTLQYASFKNNYLFQIQIILVNILTQEQNFMIKRIRRNIFKAEKILPGKIKDIMFLFLYHTFGLHFPEAIKQ